MKHCAKCQKSQPLDNYYVNRRAKDGKHHLCRDCMRGYDKEISRARRKSIIEKYGNKCECCGESTYEFLAIDHVNGGGGQERKRIGVKSIQLKLAREPVSKEYRILCHNCNMANAYWGYCPHLNT